VFTATTGRISPKIVFKPLEKKPIEIRLWWTQKHGKRKKKKDGGGSNGGGSEEGWSSGVPFCRKKMGVKQRALLTAGEERNQTGQTCSGIQGLVEGEHAGKGGLLQPSKGSRLKEGGKTDGAGGWTTTEQIIRGTRSLHGS